MFSFLGNILQLYPPNILGLLGILISPLQSLITESCTPVCDQLEELLQCIGKQFRPVNLSHTAVLENECSIIVVTVHSML